jgi:DNA-directed RNA polymerase specialized sigma subunit
LLTDPDAESFAYEALWHAAEDFDETKGNKFSTVATVYIYNALCGYMRKLNAKRQLDVVSYNALMHLSNGEEHEYLELLVSDTTVEKDFLDHERVRYAVACYNELVHGVKNEKHRKILAVWRESDFTASATSIADKVKLSQSYVSQTINNFRYQLRKLMEERYDKSN